MASHATTTVSDDMVRNHAEVWHGFTRFMIFGISAVVVLLVGMAAFLL